MQHIDPPRRGNVEQLLLNAELRNELEPFYDEAIALVDTRLFSLERENEFFASMLAWERAPSLPIAEWFNPPLEPRNPRELNADELHQELWGLINQLYEKRIVFDHTSHLTDRELYVLIVRDVLPVWVKKLDNSPSDHYIHWDCAKIDSDPTTWLTYYASEEERQCWLRYNQGPLPASLPVPYPRVLPRDPDEAWNEKPQQSQDDKFWFKDDDDVSWDGGGAEWDGQESDWEGSSDWSDDLPE